MVSEKQRKHLSYSVHEDGPHWYADCFDHRDHSHKHGLALPGGIRNGGYVLHIALQPKAKDQKLQKAEEGVDGAVMDLIRCCSLVRFGVVRKDLAQYPLPRCVPSVITERDEYNSKVDQV